MRSLTLTVALLALAAGPASAGEPASSALAGYSYCGKVRTDYTFGKVYGRRVSCPDSRSLVRLYFAKLRRSRCDRSNNFCEVLHLHGFRCVRGGSGSIVRLRCTRDTQRVRAYWGD